MLGHAHAAAGEKKEALKILEELKARSEMQYVPAYWIAVIYNGLRDDKEVFTWLERAYRERSSWLVWTKFEPRFDWIRSDPRFVSALEQDEARLGRFWDIGRYISERHKYTDMNTYTQMTSRNLSVKNDVYKKLREAKKGNESFSDVIERLLDGRHDLMAFAGILSGDKEFERVKSDIQQVRKRTVLRN